MSKCKSCGADILWIKMVSGTSMPVDAEPVMYTEGTKDVIVTPDGNVTRGNITKYGESKGYVSHFATCPNAGRHRSNRRA